MPRLTVSIATNRTVQRGRPSGGGPHTIATIAACCVLSSIGAGLGVATGVRGYQFHRHHRCPEAHRWPRRQPFAWHLRVSLEGVLHSGAETGLVLHPSGEGR